jgi:hypothetical protein
MNTFLNFVKSKKFLVGVAVVSVLVVIEFGYPVYRDWRFDRELQQLTDEINKPYLEDTYGGETPKETLEMFIAAVEDGDYELASKYFVFSKQEEWKGKLVSGKRENNIEKLIKLATDEIDILNKADPLWMSSDNYISTNRVLFEYVKYPQGIWKIKEI